MSKLLQRSACGLLVVMIVAVCISAHAAIIYNPGNSNPYNPGVTNAYTPGVGLGVGYADYVSIADLNNNNSAAATILTGATVPQGGFTTGLAVSWDVGLMELWRPTSSEVYGSPNDHGFALRNFVAAIGGGADGLLVTATVARVTVTPGAGGYKDGGSTIAIDAIIDTGTFTWNPGGNQLAWFDVTAPSEAIALDQTYATYFEWTATTTTPNNNSVVWFRGGDLDPNGYLWRKGSAATGFVTLGASGGAHPRTGAMAINLVPEPGTLVLLGLALPALLVAGRRKLRG